MDKIQDSPELLLPQAGLSPTQAEQALAHPSPPRPQLDGDEPRAKRARTTEPTSEPAPLTRRNLTRFNKMMGEKTPDASDDPSGSPKTISSGFALKARNNGILEALESKPPTNLEALRGRYARSRESASPPEIMYKHYTGRVVGARNESTMVVEVSTLLKDYYDDNNGYARTFNQVFTGYPRDVGFNKGLSAPQPDFVEGPRRRQYLPFPVDEHVAGAVLYKDDPGSITLPHIAGEWKGPAGDMNLAEVQSRYDGAALVYARRQALSYMGRYDPPGYAEVTTFTTNGKEINFFAHYAAEAEDGTLEYHQFPLKSTRLVNSYGEHDEGRRELRNAQDHAREQSYALIDQLKEHWKRQQRQQQQWRSGLHHPPIAEGMPTLPVTGTEALHGKAPPTSSPEHGESHYPHSYHSHSPPLSSKASSSSSRGARR